MFYRKRTRDLIRHLKNFKDSPEALAASEESWKTAAVIVAHPDDETFCSGLICEFAACGIEVNVLCLTKGEGGPTGGLDRSELGEARAAEMQSACDKLGVSKLEFLNHIDPVAGEHRVYAPDVSYTELADQISPLINGADLIVSHGSCGEYWHPAHLLVFDAVYELTKALPAKFDWLTFLARQPQHEIPRIVNWDDDATHVLDVSKHLSTREQALACHQSQLALFGRFADGDYKNFVEKTSTESYCRR